MELYKDDFEQAYGAKAPKTDKYHEAFGKFEAFGSDHKAQIVGALEEAGLTPTIVQTSL